MLFSFKGKEHQPEKRPADDMHIGKFENAYSDIYETPDGNLFVGFWEFAGEMEQPPRDGYDQVFILLEGSLEYEEEGHETHYLEAGDVSIDDTPVGITRLRSPGLRAVYVARVKQ